MSELMKYSEKTFEDIKHINEYGEEVWYARELQTVLEYAQCRNFEALISKAKIACEQSGNSISDHFADVSKTIEMPKNATKDIDDYMLSRYACYLIVMNGDPRKEVIALGQTYFAVKTRQQEVIENFDNLSEAQKRLAIRNEIINHNKALADAANKAGITEPVEYAIFQNWGYKGLYGGMDMKAIHAHKG
ncbi:MAG: DNA damage-inducible protein D, partial [Clostridia bacterium]